MLQITLIIHWWSEHTFGTPIGWSKLNFHLKWNYRNTIVSNSERFAFTCSITGIIGKAKNKRHSIVPLWSDTANEDQFVCSLCFAKWRRNGSTKRGNTCIMCMTKTIWASKTFSFWKPIEGCRKDSETSIWKERKKIRITVCELWKFTL